MGTHLQNVIELSLEFKVRFGFEDDFLQGFLEGLDSCLGILAELRDSLVLPLTAEALLFCFVYLTSTGNTLHDLINHTLLSASTPPWFWCLSGDMQQASITAYILTCHRRKGTGVSNNI